ncbi:MAG: tRNA glutamyl-Q(34) synthetase GluQRS [Rhodospirillaceae bacterium]|nr:tRNA glutamyl-Q(34) synthetase GluQRS [Rhodospirillaceae bacterium]
MTRSKKRLPPARRDYVTRFAPSPTGYLHLGHAKAALFAAKYAAQGRFVVRIEDIDRGRCRPEFEAAIFEDLHWLGLTWDQPVRRQSEHYADYTAAIATLRDQGLVYPCFCTRADIAREIAGANNAPHGPDGLLYPGICRAVSAAEAEERIAAGESYALRLKMKEASAVSGVLTWVDLGEGPQTARPEMFGDVVIARKDVPTSYHLACTYDDALQGMTLVTRGKDLFEATHVHRLLQKLLGLATPEYYHHDLVLGPTGQKFSKRDQAPTLRALRAVGRTPEQVLRILDL